MLNIRQIVNLAALGVAIAAAVALVLLGFWVYDLAAHRSHWSTFYRELGVIGLSAIFHSCFSGQPFGLGSAAPMEYCRFPRAI